MMTMVETVTITIPVRLRIDGKKPRPFDERTQLQLPGMKPMVWTAKMTIGATTTKMTIERMTTPKWAAGRSR